jgi:L-amino acid N-acyltransferase YncA
VSDPAGGNWVVRDAIPESDAHACLEIYAPFIRETVVSFEERVPTMEEFRERMRDTIATHPWLVLEADGRVVAYAYASQHRVRAAYRWAADVTIYSDTSHRRKGIGRRLYGVLFDRLRRQGFKIVCAGITVPNEASEGLHRAMGFQHVGTYRRIGWKAGAWHDVSWWQLQLGPTSDTPPPEPIGPAE